jgi:hypothetical protein
MYMENIPHHKDFTRSKAGDVSAFLCHFLDGRGIKPLDLWRGYFAEPQSSTGPVKLFKEVTA